MRAKFYCDSVEENDGSQEVKLSAIQSDDNPENQSFNTATPSGELSMMIDNPAAKGFFKPHSAYYLDFTPAED